MTTPCLFNAGTSYLTYGLTTPINYAPTDTSVFSVSLTTPGFCQGTTGTIYLYSATTNTDIATSPIASGNLGNGAYNFAFSDDMSGDVYRNALPAGSYTLYLTVGGSTTRKSLGTFDVTHTATAGPAPSMGMVRRGRQKPMCEMGYKACPIDGGRWACTDIQTGLTSCGGCPPMDNSWSSASSAYDCTAIEGVLGVSCMMGSCNVTSCENGYTVSDDWKTCTIASLD